MSQTPYLSITEQYELLISLVKRKGSQLQKRCKEITNIDDWATISRGVLKCFLCEKEIDIRANQKDPLKLDLKKVDEHGKMHLEELGLASFL